MEMKRAAENRMTPKYSAILQRFLNSVVPSELMKGQRIVQEQLSVPLRGDWVEDPSMADVTHTRTSSGGRGGSRSRHGSGSSSRPTRGAARFFKSLWEVCKSAYDVNHKAVQMSQETRRRQNEHFRSRNISVPEDGPALEAVPYVQFEMPPIDDSMFFGLDPSWYGGPSSSARGARSGDEDEEDDAESLEDEEEEEENDEDDEDPCL
jgi:hypothetical protein